MNVSDLAFVTQRRPLRICFSHLIFLASYGALSMLFLLYPANQYHKYVYKLSECGLKLSSLTDILSVLEMARLSGVGSISGLVIGCAPMTLLWPAAAATNRNEKDDQQTTVVAEAAIKSAPSLCHR